MTSHDHNGSASDHPSQGSGSQGSGNLGSGWNFDAWGEGLTSEQIALQEDLSCLVDGELDEVAAARAMVKIEESPDCQIFLDDIRRFARLHRDLSDPQRLEARIAMLGASEIAKAAMNIDLAHRLATIFYQLGKAYILADIDGAGFRERVFEAAVPVSDAKTQGRGFVDGVVASGRVDCDPKNGDPKNGDPKNGNQGDVDSPPGEPSPWGGRSDWMEARHLLNGRLEKIGDPLEKGRRLLGQSIEIDPSHEEARIYLAYVYGREGKKLKAASLYRDVFDTALNLANRGHAAMQLGRLHFGEGDLREALILWRWMNISGLTSSEARFNVVRFNIGVAYVQLGDVDRALAEFRQLLDAQIESGGSPAEIAALFVENEGAREIFEAHPGFLSQLMTHLPELFNAHEVK
jgi:tetratricopeptide (TPR) repeat protein